MPSVLALLGNGAMAGEGECAEAAGAVAADCLVRDVLGLVDGAG